MTNRKTRKQFIRDLVGTSCFALAGCKCPFCGGTEKPQIALQLYSIHKIFWKDPERILAELKAAGYDGVEFAGTDRRSAANLRKMLADAGLVGMGTHVNGDIELVGDALKRTLDFYADAGVRSIVTPHAARKTAAEYCAFGQAMGEAAETAAKYGIKLGVHTAPFHFKNSYDGKTAWEWIVSSSSPLLQQEIDIGNVLAGGGDPVAVLKAGFGRHYVLHAKENDATEHGILGEKPTNGAPQVAWNDVMAFARTDVSIKWWVVEAERIPDSLEPAKACLGKLKDWMA